MPIFFQQDIDHCTRLAIWKIEEEESFFKVPLQREITHPHKRQQHLAGRYLLRHLYPDFPLDLIKVADTQKPYLEDEAYHFSISHCSHYAAAIVSKNKRVGVDIEVPTSKVERIRHKFLHEEEMNMLDERKTILDAENGYPSPNDFITHISSLTMLWSAKEAVFKWWSYGSVDFSEMIRLASVPYEPIGEMEAGFFSSQTQYKLTLHYRFFDRLCLSWVAA